MTRKAPWLIALLLLAACAEEAQRPAATAPSPTPSPSPCLDQTTVNSLVDEAMETLTEASNAFGNFNGQEASAKLRSAAGTVERLADAVEETVPQAAELLNESAGALVRAADSAEQDDFGAATNSLSTGITLVNDATQEINEAKAQGLNFC